MAFDFTECFSDGIKIENLYEIQPKIFNDARGYFFENYNERDFEIAGITTKFVQDNESRSSRGVLRGLHFQTKHPQAKLVRAVIGQVYDISVDLRNDSLTFGKCHCIILDDKEKNQLYIPRGFAHGFYVLSETAIIAYKCDDFYDASGEGGIHFESVDAFTSTEALSIGSRSAIADFSAVEPILSEKDKLLPPFDKNKKYFSLDGVWLGD